MKITTRIVNWLYLKYGSKDIVAMTRKQMFGVDLSSGGLDFTNLPEEEKRAIANGAREIIENPIFDMVINVVKERFMRHARDLAEGELQMFCDRFSINGAACVVEEMNFMANSLEDKQEKAIDQYSLMES